MSIKIINNEQGYYLSIDVYGIFAESEWYKTEEELGFALATNFVRWHSCEYDKDQEV